MITNVTSFFTLFLKIYMGKQTFHVQLKNVIFINTNKILKNINIKVVFFNIKRWWEYMILPGFTNLTKQKDYSLTGE